MDIYDCDYTPTRANTSDYDRLESSLLRPRVTGSRAISPEPGIPSEEDGREACWLSSLANEYRKACQDWTQVC